MKSLRSLLILCLLPITALADQAPSVSKLKADEKLTVTFASTGCFHQFTEVYVLTRSQVEIFAVKEEWSKEDQKFIHKDLIPIGSVQLTADDLNKLDALFNYYASEHSMSCTTIDRITIIRDNGSKILDTPEYTDGSCKTSSMNNVITLTSLKQRLSNT